MPKSLKRWPVGAPVDPKVMLRLMKEAAKKPRTKKEMLDTLVSAGIYTKKGNLTKRYRGGDDE